MWRRYLVSLATVYAMFFLLGCFTGEAVAQQGEPPYLSFAGTPAGPDDLAALFKRAAVPARLYGLEGPDTLAVGEEGLFTATANIGVASLPVRIRWDFGDGVAASSLHARHRFTTPGTYPVTFTLSNSHGEATDTLSVTVVPPVEEEPSAHHGSGAEGMVRLARIDLHRLDDPLGRLCALVHELCLPDNLILQKASAMVASNR